MQISFGSSQIDTLLWQVARQVTKRRNVLVLFQENYHRSAMITKNTRVEHGTAVIVHLEGCGPSKRLVARSSDVIRFGFRVSTGSRAVDHTGHPVRACRMNESIKHQSSLDKAVFHCSSISTSRAILFNNNKI